MAIYVNAGGGGTTTGNIAANADTDVTLFTTPNTANQLYLITVQTRIDDAIDATEYPNNDFGFNQTMKVGPNVAVKIALANAGGNAAHYTATYQYVGIIIDTN